MWLCASPKKTSGAQCLCKLRSSNETPEGRSPTKWAMTHCQVGPTASRFLVVPEAPGLCRGQVRTGRIWRSGKNRCPSCSVTRRVWPQVAQSEAQRHPYPGLGAPGPPTSPDKQPHQGASLRSKTCCGRLRSRSASRSQTQSPPQRLCADNPRVVGIQLRRRNVPANLQVDRLRSTSVRTSPARVGRPLVGQKLTTPKRGESCTASGKSKQV